jgi:Protein ChrB, N-terminal
VNTSYDEAGGQQWLLYLPQLPSAPSRLRVMMWRRLRAEGATGLQNGVWVMPRTERNEQSIRQLMDDIEKQGGGRGLLLAGIGLDPAVDQTVIAQARADRDREYVEFCGRCNDLLAEIDKETRACNFTFAELEENEEDLQKLTRWLRKIQARDVFGAERAGEAAQAIDQCRQAMDGFTRKVYAEEGLDPDPDGSDVDDHNDHNDHNDHSGDSLHPVGENTSDQ